MDRIINGKSVSVRLTVAQAEPVRGWIDDAKNINRRLVELEELATPL